MLPAWLPDTVTADVSRGLHYTTLWGLEGVELRRVGHGRVPDVPNERVLRERLEAAEMDVVAIDPGLFEGPLADRALALGDLARLDDSLAFARRFDCPVVVVGAFAGEDDGPNSLAAAADVLRRAGDRAAAHGVALAVQHGLGTAAPTAQALAALLDAANHAAVGALWHPAEALRAGESATDGLAALGPRIRHVRVRDSQPVGTGGWADAVVGEGAVGWDAVAKGLAALGYRGALSLEVHPAGELPAPKSGLRSGTAVARLARTRA